MISGAFVNDKAPARLGMAESVVATGLTSLVMRFTFDV